MSKISFLPYPHAHVQDGQIHWRDSKNMSDGNISDEISYLEMILAAKRGNKSGIRIAA